MDRSIYVASSAVKYWQGKCALTYPNYRYSFRCTLGSWRQLDSMPFDTSHGIFSRFFRLHAICSPHNLHLYNWKRADVIQEYIFLHISLITHHRIFIFCRNIKREKCLPACWGHRSEVAFIFSQDDIALFSVQFCCSPDEKLANKQSDFPIRILLLSHATCWSFVSQ